MPFECVSESSTRSTPSSAARSAARPESVHGRRPVAAAQHLDVMPGTIAQGQRLRDGLLGAEAHREVPGVAAELCDPCALAFGEQAVGQAGASIKGASQPIHLQEV